VLRITYMYDAKPAIKASRGRCPREIQNSPNMPYVIVGYLAMEPLLSAPLQVSILQYISQSSESTITRYPDYSGFDLASISNCIILTYNGISSDQDIKGSSMPLIVAFCSVDTPWCIFYSYDLL
jgi:hypothetical protein